MMADRNSASGVTLTGKTARQPYLMRGTARSQAKEDVAAERKTVSYRLLAPSEIGAVTAQWEDLAANAVEANPFFAPFMLGPALRHLGGERARVLCVWSSEGARLAGLMPVTSAFGYARLPARFLQSWIYEHCFYGAPLVRRGGEADFLDGLCAFIDAEAPFGGFLRLPLLDPDGPVAQALLAAAPPGRLVYAAGAFERAVLRGGYEAEAFMAAHIGKERLKAMKRRRRRLSEVGALSFRALRAEDDLEEWARLFIGLEDSGWKGEAGTSFGKNPAHTEFLLETLSGAWAAGALRFVRLDVGGRAGAMLIILGRAGEGYAFKICHDEAFAHYSPGVALEMELLKALESMGPRDFVDSCAVPDHPMINALWPGRRRIAGYNIAGAGRASRAVLGLARRLERLGEWARGQ